MTILYHGTSLTSANSIMREGFSPLEKYRVWPRSDRRKTYFTDSRKIDNADCKAFNMGLLSLLRFNSTDKIAVLTLEVEEFLIEDDNSCTFTASWASCVETSLLTSYNIVDIGISKMYDMSNNTLDADEILNKLVLNWREE